MKDRRLTLREMVLEVELSRGSIHSVISEDLCMRRVSTKFIPKLPTKQQKQLCVKMAQNIIDRANNDQEFTKIILTGDETWVYDYDPENKFQPSQWKHPQLPRLIKARQIPSNVKVRLTYFFMFLR